MTSDTKTDKASTDYEGVAEEDMTLEQLRQRNSDAWFKRHPEVKKNGRQDQHINPE